MKRIALKYSDTKLESLTYSSSADNQKLFECVELFPPKPSTVTESGRCLNGRYYNHLLYGFKKIQFVISSNEMLAEYMEEISANLLFLQAFWKAPYKYISLLESVMPNYGQYVQVENESSGDFPISHIDNIRYLPEVVFNMIYVEAE